MTRRCAFCERETDDFVEIDDVVMCRRCAAKVDVEKALRAAGPAPPRPPGPPKPERPAPAPGTDRRRWLLAAAALAALLGGIAIGRAGCASYRFHREIDLDLREAGDLEPGRPDQARARYEEVLRLDPDDDRAREGLARLDERRKRLDRARGLVEEARRRMAALPAEVDRAVEEAVRCEGLLRQALEAAPALAEAHLQLGKVRAARGRSDRAQESLDRALELEPENIEALAVKGEVLVTLRLLLLLDQAAFPQVVKALGDRSARREGDSFQAISRHLPEKGVPAVLARLYRGIARSEWEGARRALEELRTGGAPARVREGLPLLQLAIAYLAGESRPGLVALAALTPGLEGERHLWLAILRELEKRPTGASASLHPATLRLEAAHTAPSKGAAFLGQALAACPEYLPVRLVRARILRELGDRAGADREAEAAARQAEAMALPEAARLEIERLAK